MKLKSLILQGFKSFHDRVTVDFNEGVTAIVGPNGSGKSNITDAIRWVLGEQGSANLRVNKMDELIFAGSQNKRALSYAEVTLVMDNSDHSLNLDYDEARITRRIYRSGESEYLINDSKVRLKDINELFFDTGIGKDGYSMIGQGKVDDILSGKSELRRKMIDEASGISKYKVRKNEASRNLEHSEQNLIRINDILAEIEKQKEPLEKQAKKANKYLNLREELKALDLSYLYYIIENQESYNKKLNSDILENQNNIEIAEAEKVQVIESTAKFRETIQITNGKINSLNINLEDINNSLNQSERAIALNRQELESIDKRATEREENEEDFTDRLAKLSLEIKSRQEKHEETKKNSLDIKTKMDSDELILKSINDELSKYQKELREISNTEVQISNRLNIANKNIQSELTNKEVLTQHMNILEKDLSNLEAEFKEENTTQEERVSKQKDFKDKFEEVNQKHNKLAEEINTISTSLDEKNNTLRQIENSLNEANYQVRTQENLKDSFEGYSYTVRNLMNLIKDENKNVLGPLASLLQVPAEYENAISSALGGNSQNIVVRTERDAQEMIQLLKNKQMGRATFLPINQVHAGSINHDILKKASNSNGFIGIASEILTFNEEIRPVVEYALSRTIVCETLDDAVAMARNINFRARIVSLEGDLMNAGGSMTGGSSKKNEQNSGLLSRNRVIEELKEKISKLTKDLNSHRDSIAELISQKGAKSKLFTEVETEVSGLKQELLSLKLQIEQADLNLAKLDSEIAQNKTDLNHIIEDQGKAASDLSLKESEVKKLEEELEAINNSSSELLEKVEAKRNEQVDVQTSFNSHKLNYTQLEEQAKSSKEIIERMLNEEKQISEDIRLQKQSLDTDIQRKEKLVLDSESHKQKIENFQKNKDGILEQIRELNEDLDNANSGIESSSDALNTVSTYLAKLGQEQGRLEQKLENAKNELMNQRSRLWEEYNMTFAEKDTWYKDDLDVDETKTTIDKLRKQISNLGSVNVNAIEESKVINERYEFTIKQKEDVESAAQDLKSLINYLTDKMQTQFTESFNFINEQFSEVFKELFGGGEARLILSSQTDILNSEIDIQASPPGKKIQNMLSLSGGERCLTAIALLFAIQKLNPAPFCVLDEVEAALDEANIFRFSDYIVKHSEDTQYILVTHRRGTMEAADTIYGVTMPERGVTKVISLNLNDRMTQSIIED